MAQEIDHSSFQTSEMSGKVPVSSAIRGLNLHKTVMAAALAATMALAGCGEEQPYSTYGQQEEKGVIPGLEVTNAKMVLAPVAGNPAAIYLDLAYSGDDPIAVSGAEVEGAKNAEIHNTMEWNREMTMSKAGPITFKKGDKASWVPGETHIMAFEPAADLKPGGKVKVSLKIAGARTHEFEADIQAAGDER